MSTMIRPESAADISAIRGVNERAFGSSIEADLVDALRIEGYARLPLVAVAEGQIVGHVLFSRLPIVTPTGTIDALALAPVAVLPEFQRRGIGSKLIAAGLEQCAAMGEMIVIVLGEPAFYGRFGFSAALAAPLECAYACEAFQALELQPRALRGVTGKVEYPPPFEQV